ncbi:MAG: 30S ribosomal protein S6 [Candidatus Methylacidiphilales bacterium]|nr:30S ribosomal protein S6 [Candidatus Methylacidiphilales bacterium]
MKKSYESTYILDLQGKEDGVDHAIADIKSAIEKLGGKFEGTQRMDRRKFERQAGKLDGGYYLGVTFELEPLKLDELRAKFQFDERVYRQHYLVKTRKEAAAA